MDDELKVGLSGFLVIVVVVTLIATNTIIGAGERGVKVTLGKVSPESLVEGVYFKIPFIQQIIKYDVKTQKSHIATNVFTKDIQQAKLTYVINYNLQASNAHKMYKQVGKNYKETVLVPIAEGTIKNVIGCWNASDLIANRGKATSEILTRLQEQLDDNYIEVTDFNITDIDYSDTYEKAVESKVTAEQEALKAKNKTVQVEEEAKQALIQARANAEAMRIQAQALTQNKALVEYEAVKKWNGVLPTYMMGNSVPFVNLQ